MDSTSTHRLENVRRELRARRAAAANRRALEHDLAAFTTQADLNELDAILMRHTADEAAEVRRALDRVRAA